MDQFNNRQNEVYLNLKFALDKVWRLSKPEQAQVLEVFLNEAAKKAQILQQPPGIVR